MPHPFGSLSWYNVIPLLQGFVRGRRPDVTVVCLVWEVRCFNTKYISTWIYENRVSKHFVVYLNFHCLSLYAVLSVDVGSFLGCFIIRDLCRSGCRQNFANFYLHIASVNIGGCPNESLMHDLDLLKTV